MRSERPWSRAAVVTPYAVLDLVIPIPVVALAVAQFGDNLSGSLWHLRSRPGPNSGSTTARLDPRSRSDRELTGTVQATISAGIAEVAWLAGTRWQRRGIGTEAARALVGWLERQSARTVIAHIHPGHHASAAVAPACGLAPPPANATTKSSAGAWKRSRGPRPDAGGGR